MVSKSVSFVRGSRTALTRPSGILLGVAMLAAGPAAHAVTFTTVHTFTGSADGSAPTAGLVGDGTGVLYGTTSGGGANGAGTIFKLDPATQVLTVLHSFTLADGANPSAGLTFKNGALYGTTLYGGTSGSNTTSGTVFKLDPVTQVLTVLHSFINTDGSNPRAMPVFDKNGVLYGTTSGGGANGGGTIFKLDPATQVLTTLYSFSFRGTGDGHNPFAGVVFDTKGALYGTTYFGGLSTDDAGTVFKFDPATNVYTVLHAFARTEGANSTAQLIFDTNGALYGTTQTFGPQGHGMVFKLDPATKVLTALHVFTGPDGGFPEASLVFDTKGVLYGTTSSGGSPGTDGTVFRLDPATKKLTTLHAFTGPPEGIGPLGGLACAGSAVYSTTWAGGSTNLGTVFKLAP